MTIRITSTSSIRVPAYTGLVVVLATAFLGGAIAIATGFTSPLGVFADEIASTTEETQVDAQTSELPPADTQEPAVLGVTADDTATVETVAAPTCSLRSGSGSALTLLDYTNDDTLDEEDTQYLLEVATGIHSCPSGTVCDINNDGSVTATDSLQFAKYFANVDLTGTHTLVWSTTNARSFSLNQSIGQVVPVGTGITNVSPTQTTTYTGTATGPGGSDTCSVTIEVVEAPRPSCTLTDTRFTDSSGRLMTTLAWTTQNAQRFNINHGIENLTPVAAGSITVPTTATTTYIGTAWAANDAIGVASSCNATIIPPEPPETAPPACTLRAIERSDIDYDNDGSITSADADLVLRVAVGTASCPVGKVCDVNGINNVTADDARMVLDFANHATRSADWVIAWRATNADDFDINQGIGDLGASGTGLYGVSPTVTTTYTGTAVGNGQTTHCTVTIVVAQEAPTCTLKAIPPDTLTLSAIDYDNNGVLNDADAQYLLEVAVGSKSCPVGKICDLNGDGVVRSDGDSLASDAHMMLLYVNNPNRFGELTLQWSTTKATAFSLNQGIGARTPIAIGTTGLAKPTVTTTYTGTATGPGGSDTCSVTVTVGTATRPDLVAHSITSAFAFNGVPKNVEFLVGNLGVPVTVPTVQRIKVSRDSKGVGAIDLTTTMASIPRTPNTTPGSVGPHTFVYDPTRSTYSIWGAAFFMQLCVDTTNVLDESREDNNCTTWDGLESGDDGSIWDGVVPGSYIKKEVLFVLGPEVTAGSVSPTTATAGTQFTLTAPVSNAGSQSTAANFQNKFQLATDAQGTGAVDIGTHTQTTLMPEWEDALNWVPTMPQPTITASVPYTFSAPGTYYVRACADSSNAFGELIEFNNCGPWTPIVVGRDSDPDPEPSCTLTIRQGEKLNEFDYNDDGKLSYHDRYILQDVADGKRSCPVGKDCDINNDGSVTPDECVLWSALVRDNAYRLTWTTNNGTVLVIVPGVFPDGVGVEFTTSGTTWLSPTTTTQYTGTVTGPGGTNTCTATAVVDEPPPAPTCSLTPAQSQVDPNTAGSLNWTTTGATSFSINQGIGSVTPVEVGSASTSPLTADTVFTGTATNSAGVTTTCTATITVKTGGGGGGGGDRDPVCSLSANPTTVDSGGTSVLSWTTERAVSLVINQGVGTVATTSSSVTTPALTSNTTFIGTVTDSDGDTATCSTNVTINTGGGGGDTPSSGGGGSRRPRVTLSSTPNIGEVAGAYVYLSQAPYTGLDLGPAGAMVYWLALIIWSLALAYLVLFGALPYSRRYAHVFAERVSAVVNAHETQSSAPRTVVMASAPIAAQEPEHSEAPRGYSSYEGFKSFAHKEALSIEDIVKGLTRAHKIPAPHAVQESVSAHTEPIYEHVEPVEPAEAHSMTAYTEQTSGVSTDVRGFTSALVQGDRATVFAGLRQHVLGGGSAESLISKAACLIDDAFRARVDGTVCDPEIARLTARMNTSSLEKLVAALTNAIDSSYSTGVTGAKLALTRALNVIGA